MVFLRQHEKARKLFFALRHTEGAEGRALALHERKRFVVFEHVPAIHDKNAVAIG